MEGPIDLVRRSNSIGKPELGGVVLPGRTSPAPVFFPVSIAVMLGKLVKILLRLPFLPSDGVLTQHEIIGGM